MKRVSMVVLALLMLMAVFTGCQASAPTTSSAPSEEATQAVQESQAPASAEPSEPASPMADERVRQAMAYAIDMKTINETLFKGMGVPADGSVTPPGEWRTTSSLNAYSYDPEKAKELLKEANWDPNYVIDCVFYYGDQTTVDFLTAVQQYLADVGMKMNFRKLEGDLASQLWVPPTDPVNGPSAINWDLAYAACSSPALHDYYNRFMTANAANSHTPSDPELDKLIQPTNETANTEEQKQLFYKVQEYENTNLPALPLYYQPVYIAESTRLDRGGAPYGNDTWAYNSGITSWDVPADKDGVKRLYTNSGAMDFFEMPFLNPGFFFYNMTLYDHLLLIDENLQPIGGQMASDYKVSDDYMTVEFTLREGMKWHDGSAITPDDVKKTFEFVAKVPTAHTIFANTLKSLEGYDDYINGKADGISGIVIDGNKITFNFAILDPNFNFTFSQLAPLPMKYFENVDPLQAQQAEFWQHPIGSGPFKVKEAKMNDYTVLERFDDYYGEKAKIEEVQMYPSGESDANLVKNASAGLVDYAFTKSIEDVLNLQTMENMKVTPVMTNYTRMFFINKFLKPTN